MSADNSLILSTVYWWHRITVSFCIFECAEAFIYLLTQCTVKFLNNSIWDWTLNIHCASKKLADIFFCSVCQIWMLQRLAICRGISLYYLRRWSSKCFMRTLHQLIVVFMTVSHYEHKMFLSCFMYFSDFRINYLHHVRKKVPLYFRL